ncbi:MAG TPA: hypothetical protein VGI85_04180 [Chthoniobacterales bacterium]
MERLIAIKTNADLHAGLLAFGQRVLELREERLTQPHVVKREVERALGAADKPNQPPHHVGSALFILREEEDFETIHGKEKMRQGLLSTLR